MQVRGTARNIDRASWLLDFFNSEYIEGPPELAKVPDMAAFNKPIQDCAGAIHTATPVIVTTDPNVAIPMAIAGTTNAMTAVAKAGIKRFVLISPSTTAASPVPNKVFNIDPSMWSESAGKPPGLLRPMKAYNAGSASTLCL